MNELQRQTLAMIEARADDITTVSAEYEQGDPHLYVTWIEDGTVETAAIGADGVAAW